MAIRNKNAANANTSGATVCLPHRLIGYEAELWHMADALPDDKRRKYNFPSKEFAALLEGS